MNKLIVKYKKIPVQLKASFWFLICSFLQQGVSVITTPIFTRIMSTAEYGRYSVFYSWQSIVTIFVSLRLYFGVYTQGLVKFEDDRKVFSSSLQGLTLTLCGGWFGIYLLFHSIINKSFSLNTKQMICMFILIWTTAVFNFWAAEQRVVFKYKKLVLISIVVAILEPVLGIIFVLNFQDKVTARILSLVVVEVSIYFSLFISQLKAGKVFYSHKYWKYALAFNIPLIPHYLSQTVLNSTDRLMINSMIGSDEAGIYSLAYSISQIMLLFNTALLQTITPWMYQKIKGKEEKKIANIAYIGLIIIGIVNLILIVLAPEAVSIFAPKTYYSAIWIIPPVSMSVYFVFAYSLFANFEFYFEKTQYITVASICAALLNIILNYIFIPQFGYYAAGYTTLVCYIVYAAMHYVFMLKINKECMNHVKVYDWKILLLISGSFVCLGFIFMFTYKKVIYRYMTVFLGVLVAIITRKKGRAKLQGLLDLKKN